MKIAMRAVLGATIFLAVSAAAAKVDENINAIRKEYAAIQKSLPALSKRVIDSPHESTEGGTVSVFRGKDGNPRLIREELSGETGKAIREFFYKAGKVFFVLEQQHKYNAPIFMDKKRAKEMDMDAFNPAKTEIHEDRYYFYDGQLIQWSKDNKTEVEKGGSSFKDKEKELLQDSKTLLKEAEKTRSK